MAAISVTDVTLERMYMMSGMTTDKPSELCEFYTTAIQGDFKETYTLFLQDISKYLLAGRSPHRLTTAEDLYAFRVIHNGITYNCHNDYTFIGSDLRCDIVIPDTQACILIIVIIPRVNRILIIDPGTDVGFKTVSHHLHTSPVSVPGKRVFGVFDIHDNITVCIADNTLHISANEK